MLEGSQRMPRLSKIRLVGCKYDGLTKQHENSVFDLTKDQEAVHSLFTLGNGSGKGVMMQLMFQLLIPETKWGKTNGNKVISMFYDKKNNLHSDTFHVALEWILDTVPQKRLITGIAVRAIIKNTSNDHEEKTGLSYFLYTHEHDNQGYHKIENLPLYNEKENMAEDLDRVDDFISSNKRDFIKYSQSSVRRNDSEYFRYLENRGIYRSEWLNLKKINKLEGGAGDYFIGARDNKSVFDKVIIPAISENLSNYTQNEGNSLIDMFKSNLSITKDLPLLIKREASYKELLLEMKPLIENATSGAGFLEIKNRLINEGNDLYFILNEEASLVKADIEKWDYEGRKAEEEQKVFEFQRDNLYYKQEEMALEKTKKEYEGLLTILDKTEEEIKVSKETIALYKINEILHQKKAKRQEIEDKTLQKQKLIQSLGLTDIEDKAHELDQAIEGQWDETKAFWVNNENQYHGYMRYTDKEIEDDKASKKQYIDEVEALQNDVNKFELKEEALEKEKKRLGECYDFVTLAFPENIAEELTELKQKLIQDIDEKTREIESCHRQLRKLSEEVSKLEYQLNSKEEAAHSLKEEVRKQGDYELEVARQVTRQLLVDYNGELLDHGWFARKEKELESMEESKGQSLGYLQQTIWEKNSDIGLNKEDYFIPNKDILTVKSQIKQIGIHVETGSEYLHGLPEDKREMFLNSYPDFIYSVVISTEKDWELISKNIDKGLFLNNMVPIYIRQAMEKGGQVFKTLEGKAATLVDKENYIRWKDALSNEIDGLLKTEGNLKSDLRKIIEIKQDLNIIGKNTTALILSQKLKKQEDELLEIKTAIRNNKEEKSIVTSKLEVAKAVLEEKSNRKNKCQDNIQEIKKYIEMAGLIETEKKTILKVKSKIKELKGSISERDISIDHMIDSQSRIMASYFKWQLETKSIIEDLQTVFGAVVYDYTVDESHTSRNIPDFSTKAHKLIGLLGEKKTLNQSMAQRNNQIAIVDNDLKHFNKDLDRFKEDLKTLSPRWDSYEYLELPLDQIKMMLKKVNKDHKNLIKISKSLDAKVSRTKGGIGVMEKNLEDKKRQIYKDHKKYPVLVELKEISKQINIIERDIKSNKRYLEVCHETLQEGKEKELKLTLNLNRVKTGYPLELTRGKIDDILKEKTKNNPDLAVENWLKKCENNKSQIDKTEKEGEGFRTNFIKEMTIKLEESKLKDKIMAVMKETIISNFNSNSDSFKSMENHFQQELDKLSKDKGKAEAAMKQWTSRSAIHVMRMVEALKSMVSSMNYINEQGYAFPLVKLKGAERLPKEEAEIAYLLDEYFVQAISKVIEENEDVSSVDDKLLKDLMGDGVIFSKALQGRYPTLMVYKMSEKNEFRYARAREEYYTTWEAINKGEGISPEGSGGQTLSVNTFVIMMIMSFKKKHIGNENPSTVLILDNPFGAASAKHMLDPIFEIADKLNFQLICFAAPEIIKVEISERFPIFWELKVESGKIIHGGRIMRK